VIVTENGPNFILHVPSTRKLEIAPLMAYRGLVFSTSASTRENAILWSLNPYALADLAAPDSPTLGAYRQQIELSRALDGKGTTRLPPGRELWDFQKATLDYLCGAAAGSTGTNLGSAKPRPPLPIATNAKRSARLSFARRPSGSSGASESGMDDNPQRQKVSVMLRVKDGIHPTAHYQVISYDAARNPAIIRAISKYQWDVLICDEAHKMKNIEALTTRAIIGNSRGEYQHGEIRCRRLPSIAAKHLALTGTLLLNRPSEAYVLFRFFDWEAIDFASEDKFKERYNRQADMKTIEGKRFKLESTSLENELQNRLAR
jgi:hypothetical protein